MISSKYKTTKPNLSVDFPISLTSRENFHLLGELFGLRKPVKPKQAAALFWIDREPIMLSGLFLDARGDGWVRYSGDIKEKPRGECKRYFFTITVTDDKQVTIDPFGRFWEGFLSFRQTRDTQAPPVATPSVIERYGSPSEASKMTTDTEQISLNLSGVSIAPFYRQY